MTMASSVSRSLALLIASGVGIICVIVVVRTVTFSVHSDDVVVCKVNDSDFIRAGPEIIKRFQSALKFETVTVDAGSYNTEELRKFKEFVVKAFPLVHSSPLVKFEVVAEYSLLYTIKGSDSSLRPYMLTSHIDVVPADSSQWEEPPFSGKLTNGYIYGRGAIDDKHGVMGTYEALEYLLATGFKPKRGLYIGFGHDEEGQGNHGAASIAKLLSSRGLTELEFLVDEGLTVIEGILSGVDVPLGLIGTSEKGQVILELTTESAAGHSSMPPKETSIGILARAVARLEENPHPSMFGRGPEKGTFEHLAHTMDWTHLMLLSNLWLFSPIIAWKLSQKPSTNAVVRTVSSVTMFNAGVKDNVLATHAKAIINHRIHPSQTVEEVIEYDRKLINDERVKIRVKYSMEPLPMSPYGEHHFGYQTLKNSITQVFPVAAVAPSVMIGNTDTRHYIHLTENIYRFSPTHNFPEDLARFHGHNERISVKNYEQAINFYYHLMINANEPKLKPIHEHSDEL